MFDQLGAGTKTAAENSKSMVQLAADIASFHNVAGGAEAVLNAMMSAFRGEYDALQRYIPTIKAASVEQLALAETGKKSAKELTELEKATAAMHLIMRDAGAATGDFARTSDQLANQQRILEANITDTLSTIGDGLKPMVTLLYREINNWFIANQNIIKQKMPELILYTADALALAVIGVRAFHNAWLGIKLVAATVFEALNIGVEGLMQSLRLALFPLDKIYDLMVRLGVMKDNPIDGIMEAMRDWTAASGDVKIEIINDIIDVNDGYEATIGRIADMRAELSQFGKVSETVNEEIIKQNKELTEDIIKKSKHRSKIESDAMKESVALIAAELQEEKKSADERIKLEQDVARVAIDIRNDAAVKQIRATKTVTDGIRDGLRKMVADYGTAYDSAFLMTQQFANAAKNSISDGLFGLLKGDMDSFKDAWQSFTDSLLRVFTDMLADMAAKWAANQVIQWLGGSPVDGSGGGLGGSGGGTVANAVVNSAVSQGVKAAAKAVAGWLAPSAGAGTATTGITAGGAYGSGYIGYGGVALGSGGAGAAGAGTAGASGASSSGAAMGGAAAAATVGAALAGAVMLKYTHQPVEWAMNKITGGWWGGGKEYSPKEWERRMDWVRSGGPAIRDASAVPSMSNPLPKALTQYYHGGGIVGEVPAVLEKGEGVFTKGQMKAMGSPGPINITVQVGSEEFEAIIANVADGVRVKAERRNMGVRRLYG
uniref:Putative tail tape measure protein n=1 Tax=viral metagenome TaxID=1070528 RepID=A0A6M3K9S6_9ZZZZ